jgi:hypothetical protein
MATEAQIKANRLNAQKSTGPRTEEGKRVVSQNAVKHGLFAREAVIKCEDPAAFELHREALLDELRPVGVMESILAERIVSLSWRLQRVERMQNQATDCLIEEDHLPLGRMITDKWKDNVRTIERLFMHERRIESSMNRTITKLKKLQIVRRIEREDAEERLAATAAAPFGHNSDFAEQSQYAPGLMGSTSFMERCYDDTAHPDTAENKADSPAQLIVEAALSGWEQVRPDDADGRGSLR